jgi:hypothetical protein
MLERKNFSQFNIFGCHSQFCPLSKCQFLIRSHPIATIKSNLIAPLNQKVSMIFLNVMSLMPVPYIFVYLYTAMANNREAFVSGNCTFRPSHSVHAKDLSPPFTFVLIAYKCLCQTCLSEFQVPY